MTYLLPITLSALAPRIHEEPNRWQLQGSMETTSMASSAGVGYRQFDQVAERIRITNARLIVIYRDSRSGLGLTFEPWAGDTAEILYRTEPAASTITKYVGQAYLSYTMRDGSNLDIGKFNSWIGYESPLGADGEFMSRGLLYTLAQPAYHLGSRFRRSLAPTVSTSVFVTQGWNQIQRNTGGATLGAQAKWTASPTTQVTLGYIGGQEGATAPNRAGSFGGIGFSNAGRTNVQLLDFIITSEVSPQAHLAFNADYAWSGQVNNGRWYGASAVGRYSISAKESVALRVEWFTDPDAIRTGSKADLSSATVNYERKVTSQLMARIEGRIDGASKAIFGPAGAPSKHQSTISFGLVLRF